MYITNTRKTGDKPKKLRGAQDNKWHASGTLAIIENHALFNHNNNPTSYPKNNNPTISVSRYIYILSLLFFFLKFGNRQ